MPQKCSVLNCRGNYRNGPKVSVFSFPNDLELRKKWIKSVHRGNFEVSNNSKVCEKHFRERDIRREVSAFDEKSGRIITAPLSKPRLVENAVPSVFPSCMSSTGISSIVQENPGERRERINRNYSPNSGDVNKSTSADSTVAGHQVGNAVTSCNDRPETFASRETPKSSATSDCEEDSEKIIKEQHVLEKVKANLCRVCGCSGGSLTSIFEETCSSFLHGLPLVNVLAMYLPLQVGINDSFPLSICSKCYDTLCEWHQFYVTCVAANKSFKNLFGRGNDQEASRSIVQLTSVQKDTGVLEGTRCTKSLKNDHNYVKVELEEPENIEQDVELEEPENIEQDVELEEPENIEQNVELEEPEDAEHNFNVNDFHELNKEIRENNQSSKQEPSFCKYCYHSLNGTKEMEPDIHQNQDNVSAAVSTRVHYCKFCHQSFYSMKETKSHVELCKEQPAVCDKCGKILLHRKLLPDHKYRIHHYYLRVCDKCGISVPSKRFRRHCDTFHSGSYYCNLCCTVLKSKIIYNEHMRRHAKGEIKSRLKITPLPTEEGVPMYQCPVCGDLYKDLPTMIVHLNKSKTIQCSSCSLKFNNEKRLAIHNCKKWECRFCHKSFFSRERFMEHERIHTGQKPYKCDFCSASFKRKNQRIVHQRTHSAPSHECKYCGKKFKLAVSLSNHINAHEGVYFSCTFCEKKFPGEKYLQKHMKTHEID